MKINIVNSETDIKTLDLLPYSERYNILQRASESMKQYGFDTEEILSFIEMFEENDGKYIPKLTDMLEIILQYICKFASIRIETNLNTDEGVIPWSFWLPKTPEAGVYRIFLMSRARVNVLNLKEKLYFGADEYVDIYGIVHNGVKYDMSQIKSIFLSIIFNRQFKTAAIQEVPEIFPYVSHKIQYHDFTSDHDYKYIEELSKYFDMPEFYTSIESFITQILYLRILSFYIKKADLTTEITKQQNITTVMVKRKKTLLESIARDYWKFSAKKLFPAIENGVYSDKEIREIDAQHKIHINFLEKRENNVCEHAKIIIEMDKLIKFSSKLKQLHILEKFMANKDTKESWIMCNICGFPIMCPHKYTYTLMICNGKPYADVINKMNDFVSFSRVSEFGFCKICNDEIGDRMYDDVDGDMPTGEHYAIKKKMTMDLLMVYSYIKTTPEISQYEFVNFVKNNLFRIFINSNSPQLKRLLLLHDESNTVSSTMHIYIVMYVYAFILNMIRAYNVANDLTYIKITFKEKTKSNDIKEQGNALLQIFANKYDGLSRNNLDINILTVLEGAYLDLYNSGTNFLIRDAIGKSHVVFNMIQNQSAFRYAHHIYNTFEPEPVTVMTEKAFQVIAGMGLAELTTIGYNSDVNILEKMYRPSYKNNLLYEKFGDGYERDLKYINYIIYASGDKTKYSEVKIYDDVIALKVNILKYIPCYVSLCLSGSCIKNLYHPSFASLKLIYDEQGNEHVWDTFIFSTKEVKKDLPREPGLGKIIDYRCSICGSTKTDLAKLDDSKISKALLKKTRHEAVMTYFLNICPESKQHTFANGVCKTCGYNLLGAEAEKYVSKYFALFEKMTSIQNTPRPIQKEEKDITVDWKYNESLSIYVSDMCGLSHNLIKAIGSTETLTESAITNSGVKLPLPVSRSDMQLAKIYSYILILLSEFNRLRNITTTSQYYGYIDLEAILVEENIPVNSWHNLHKTIQLPQHPYLKNIDSYVKKNKPADICMFLHNTFCKIVKDISQSDIGKKFAIKLVKKVVQQELAMSKDGEYNKALFSRKMETFVSEKENEDVDYSNDVEE